MRDIPKWRSQKAVWVPFIVCLEMSVWTVLQEVLTADAGKQLFFQKSPVCDKPDPTPTMKSNDETGTFIFGEVWSCSPFVSMNHSP